MIRRHEAIRIVIARTQRGRGNLGKAVAFSPMAFPRFNRVLRDCHVGRWPPRNDKLGGIAPLNLYRKYCQPAWRSLSAATDVIGAYYFNDGRYESAVPSRDCTPRALPRASRSGRHVGLRPPRNDKSGGVCHFDGGLYGLQVRRRARLSPRLQRANSCLAQLRIFVKMYLTFREQADIIKMWKPRRLPQT